MIAGIKWQGWITLAICCGLSGWVNGLTQSYAVAALSAIVLGIVACCICQHKNWW